MIAHYDINDLEVVFPGIRVEIEELEVSFRPEVNFLKPSFLNNQQLSEMLLLCEKIESALERESKRLENLCLDWASEKSNSNEIYQIFLRQKETSK